MKESVAELDYPYNCPTGKWTLVATILASAMAFIDATSLNVILPSLQRDLEADGLDLFWVLNSYLLMLAALIIVGGSLGDKLGRVKIFKVGIAIFIVGSILCGLSSNIQFLIIFRALQGIGGALMIPGSLAIISAVFSKKERGKAIGTWSAITTIVTICGPVFGGALADIGLWRLIFFINVPLGILAILISHAKIPESYEPGASKIDYLGATILILSLLLMTFGLLEMPELGYDHWIVLACLLIGLVLFVCFIYVEKSSENPMIPLELFKSSTFSGVNLLSFFLYAALGGMMLFLSLNIIQIQGYSQLLAGLTFLPFSFMMILLAKRMGGFTDKYGSRNFLIAGPTITGFGILWFAFIGVTDGPSDYWTTFFPAMLVFALGMSITVVPLTTTAMGCVDESKSGIASGINNSITRIAGTFMNAILGAIAIFIFIQEVDYQMNKNIDLNNTLKKEIITEAYNLGEAIAPFNLSSEMQTKVNQIYDHAFIDTYQWIAMTCAFLAFLSAFIAFISIKSVRNDKA